MRGVRKGDDFELIFLNLADSPISSSAAFCAVIAFVLRYLIIRKAENNFDVYGHLYFIRQIKEKGKGPFRSIETNILESEDLDNPFLWHWIAGFLPTEFTLRHNNLLNPLLDATYISIIYALSLMMGIH